MKRAILLALTMGAILSVEAQSNEALMRKGFVRDSLAEVLAEHRINYAKNPSMRERLTPVILSLEQELLNLQDVFMVNILLLNQLTYLKE